MVVAIDGPGGAGKSTVAATTAAVLGLPHLDTGATYRAATVAALHAGADPADGAEVAAAIAGVAIGYEQGRVWLDGEDITEETRSPEVVAVVSEASAHQVVRRVIVALQRAWVVDHGGDAVVEGPRHRDRGVPGGLYQGVPHRPPPHPGGPASRETKTRRPWSGGTASTRHATSPRCARPTTLS